MAKPMFGDDRQSLVSALWIFSHGRPHPASDYAGRYRWARARKYTNSRARQSAKHIANFHVSAPHSVYALAFDGFGSAADIERVAANVSFGPEADDPPFTTTGAAGAPRNRAEQGFGDSERFQFLFAGGSGADTSVLR